MDFARPSQLTRLIRGAMLTVLALIVTLGTLGQALDASTVYGRSGPNPAMVHDHGSAPVKSKAPSHHKDSGNCLLCCCLTGPGTMPQRVHWVVDPPQSQARCLQPERLITFNSIGLLPFHSRAPPTEIGIA